MDAKNEITFRKFIAASLAGGSAGISIDCVLFPIDSIKTRIQASSKKEDFRK